MYRNDQSRDLKSEIFKYVRVCVSHRNLAHPAPSSSERVGWLA